MLKCFLTDETISWFPANNVLPDALKMEITYDKLIDDFFDDGLMYLTTVPTEQIYSKSFKEFYFWKIIQKEPLF